MSIEEIKKNFYKNKKITQFNIDEYRNEYIKHLEQKLKESEGRLKEELQDIIDWMNMGKEKNDLKTIIRQKINNL